MQTCKICGSSKLISYHHPKFNILFHECKTCEVIYKDDRHKISLDDEYKVYENHQNTLDNEGYVKFLSDFIDQTVIPYKKCGDLLDFGSGPSPVLSYILKRQYMFHVSIYDIFYAKGVNVFNKTYDVITSTEVFEHLSNPNETFVKLKKSLKDGGILAVMTLFHPNNLDKFNDWFYIRDPSHITFYTPKTFKVLAKKHGFEVLYTNEHRYITLKKITLE